MPIVLANDTYEELVRAYRVRTGEEPSGAVLEILRIEADWLTLDPPERERLAAEKLKAMNAALAGMPVLTREEKDAIWAELDVMNEELFEDDGGHSRP